MTHKLLICQREWEWKGMGMERNGNYVNGMRGMVVLIKLRWEWDGKGNKAMAMRQEKSFSCFSIITVKNVRINKQNNS